MIKEETFFTFEQNLIWNHLRLAITILLIFCVLLQTFSKLSIIANYQLNKEFIAKVLCLNKAKPQLGCEGKCYLSKQLGKAEEHEHSLAGHAASKSVLLFVQQLSVFNFQSPSVSIAGHTPYLYHTYSFPSFSVFTPPKI